MLVGRTILKTIHVGGRPTRLPAVLLRIRAAKRVVPYQSCLRELVPVSESARLWEPDTIAPVVADPALSIHAKIQPGRASASSIADEDRLR